jgi:hypothetical protein
MRNSARQRVIAGAIQHGVEPHYYCASKNCLRISAKADRPVSQKPLKT